MEQAQGTATGGSIFAVGDIHGCEAKLSRLLDALPFVPGRDRLVFLGDYINRGPATRGVLERLVALAQRLPDTVFLLGNHEQALLDYARSGDVDLLPALRSMGVEATLKSYGDARPEALRDLSFMPAAHVDFLARLLPFHRERGFLFVHAGVNPAQAADAAGGAACEGAGTDAGDAPTGGESLTVRDMFLSCEPTSAETVVFGHTGFDTPFLAPGKIGIDTGAWQGNLLTAVELPAVIFHHA